MDEFVTLPQVLALSKYWLDFPPVHKLVAGYIGYDPAKAKAAAKVKEGGEDQDAAFGAFIGAALDTGLARMK